MFTIKLLFYIKYIYNNYNMNIYVLETNLHTESKNFKTLEDAIQYANNLLNNNPTIKIKIFNQEFNDDFQNSDVSCRIYLVYEN
jgi:hypothetical protein